MARAIVTVKNNAVVAISRDVAAYFGRRDDYVLQAIDSLDPAEFASLNFQEWHRDHPTVRGRTVRTVDMTRDGFTLLAMGFTGAKALQVAKTSAHNSGKDRSLTP
ncbi:Rha family transcriptional regulator [Sinorhizobium fredii]